MSRSDVDELVEAGGRYNQRLVENSTGQPPRTTPPLPDGTPPPLPDPRFQTIEEAEAYVRQNYPSIEVDFTGANPAKISYALDVLDDYARLYPNALDDIPIVRFTTQDPPAVTHGGKLKNMTSTSMITDADNIQAELFLNVRSWWSNYPAPTKLPNIPGRYDPWDYRYDVAMRHELGHHMEKVIYNRWVEGHQRIQDFMIDNKHILRDLSPTSTDIASYSSEERLGEFFAESFAAIRYTPAILSEETIDYLRRFETLLNEVTLGLNSFNPTGNIQIPKIPLTLD